MRERQSDFESEMEGVQPLSKRTQRVPTNTALTEPNPRKEALRQNATLDKPQNYLSEELLDENVVLPDQVFQWRRDGLQSAVVKNLRNGYYQPNQVLDLHHKSIREARELIWDFIESSRESGHRTVSIVHGKGARSNPPARLKSYVGQVLKEHANVFAFCSAPREMGGEGATLVWLKKSENEKLATRERIQSRQG